MKWHIEYVFRIVVYAPISHFSPQLRVSIALQINRESPELDILSLDEPYGIRAYRTKWHGYVSKTLLCARLLTCCGSGHSMDNLGECPKEYTIALKDLMCASLHPAI
jgi:hypothetical protein